MFIFLFSFLCNIIYVIYLSFTLITKNNLKKQVLVNNNNTGLYLLLDLLTINKNVFHHYLILN